MKRKYRKRQLRKGHIERESSFFEPFEQFGFGFRIVDLSFKPLAPLYVPTKIENPPSV